MPKKTKSLMEELSALSEVRPKDFDPEDIHFNTKGGDDASDSDASDDLEAGRSHYVQVGKSKLRMNQDLEMPQGKAYQGTKTSRKGLFGGESEEDDEEDEDEDDEIDDEDEDLNGELDEDEDEVSEEEVDDDEEDELNGLTDGINGYDDDDDDDDDDDEDSNEDDEESTSNDTLSQLQQFQNQEKELIQTLHKNTVQDSDKGKHVLNQLNFWESVLGTRIQFQKIIQNINQLPVTHEGELDWDVSEHQDSIDGLVQLINQLMKLRVDLAFNTKSEENKFEGLEKRKFESTQKDDLWDDISALYDVFFKHHEGIVDKWHSKVQLGNTLPLQKKFRSLDQSISQQVDQMMMDSDRLIARSRSNRSNQPIIGHTGDSNEIDQIYDDGDFYQQLLREFIESRMTDHDANGVGLRWMATKRAKQRKVVDTKASKGRKLRYQVHDKLENFMVPIHDGTWHDSKIDELFGSLLGNQFTLSNEEKAEENDQPEEVEEVTMADDGLRIFG